MVLTDASGCPASAKMMAHRFDILPLVLSPRDASIDESSVLKPLTPAYPLDTTGARYCPLDIIACRRFPIGTYAVY